MSKTNIEYDIDIKIWLFGCISTYKCSNVHVMKFNNQLSRNDTVIQVDVMVILILSQEKLKLSYILQLYELYIM